MKLKFFRLMEGEPGAPGGGAAAPAAPAPPAASPAAAPPAGEPPAAAPAASALSSAAAAEWTPATVPEKFHVKNDAGELDLAATMRKVDEHRSNLEKRLGTGDIRPKTADEYKLPDSVKDLQMDEAATAAFRAEAHEMGLTQKQYEGIVSKWAKLAPELVSAAKTQTVDEVVGTLKTHWGDAFSTEMQGAYRAAQSVAAQAGLAYDEVDAAIGNNPVAIRLFAALSKEMREDATPAAANGGTGGGKTIDELMADPAYMDARNPNHAAVSKQVAAYFERQAARQPAA